MYAKVAHQTVGSGAFEKALLPQGGEDNREPGDGYDGDYTRREA